ncbi:MAG: hypothetical protein ACXWKY_17635 [Caulobacteraceae bacterium]
MNGMRKSGVGRGPRRIMALGLGAGAAVGLIIVAAIHFAAVPGAEADKAYWAVSGPPCPVTTQAAQATGRPLAQVLDFGTGHFARSSGAIQCKDLTNGLGLIEGTTCQFNSPRRLAVSSKGGAAYFDIPNALPATVTVSDTRPPRCVLAANYKGD